MEKKYYTPEEANELLPVIRSQLAALQQLVAQIEEGYAELHRLRGARTSGAAPGNSDGDPDFERESRLEFLRIEADVMMNNFVRLGVLLKMLRPGLVDFPSLLNGEEVLLCWKEGEAQVAHYHTWFDGFAGRKRLDAQ